MFTIKHIKNDKGKSEETHSVVSYEFHPLEGKLVGHGSPSTADGEIVFRSGRAYAMNDAGQTVGAFNLNVDLKA